MSENKNIQNENSVEDFLNSIENEQRKKDTFEVVELMKTITGLKPKMWGDSIVGFGSYHYKYASGREGDYFITGFAPRKANLSVYIIDGLEKYAALLEKLGKHETSVSCLYITKLDKIDREVLKEIITKSYTYMCKNYPVTKD
jgi:glycine cleavage system protein P-like pyridoxal-binding family